MYYDEMLEIKRANPIPKQAWACDCRTPLNRGQQQFSGRMYPTEVDNDGICLRCERYALKMDENVLMYTKQRGKGFNDMRYKKCKI